MDIQLLLLFAVWKSMLIAHIFDALSYRFRRTRYFANLASRTGPLMLVLPDTRDFVGFAQAI